MINNILNHRYPIMPKGWKKQVIRFFRIHLTQRKWFHYFYHRLFGHRIVIDTGYSWCEYCDYHQERFEKELYIVTAIKAKNLFTKDFQIKGVYK